MNPSPMTLHLKPVTPDLRVTHPGTRDALPPDGAVVELTSYWRERIRDGSVVVVVEKHAQPGPSEGSTPRAPRPTKKD